MDKFVTSIKKKYKERLINRETQWPPCHSNKLVKLELVKKEKGKVVKRTSIVYQSLFTEKEPQGKKVRKALVEGDAGIGKTTLCTALSEDWANGKILQQFELLLYLPLRHREIASAGSLRDLLKLLHSSANIRESVVSYIEEDEGEKVLIIADGWDEVGGGRDQSFLYKLFSGKIFPLISVLLTSRPSASSSLHFLPSIEQFIEVVGFSKENIEGFIRSELITDCDGEKKVHSLLEQLEGNPLIESICSVPLNCAILCHLWRTLGEARALPTTMTGLYKKIILNVMLRNIRKDDAHCNLLSLSSFASLPEGLQQSWLLLCEFAFQLLEKNQLVFSEAELESFPKDLSNSFCFGLLQSTNLVYETGRGVSFHFLHRTIQEYLATMHLVRQPPDSQLKVFKSHSSSSGISFMALRFYFGILFSRNVENVDIESIIYYASGMHLDTFESFEFPQPLHLCHCAFEAGNKIVTDKVIQYLIKSNVCFNYNDTIENNLMLDHPHSAHDCAAILYIISNMQECKGMVINFSKSGVRVKQLETLADMLASKHGKIQVTGLNLHGNKLTDESVSNIFNTASTAFNFVDLDLGDNEIGDISVDAITVTLEKSCSNNLSTLILSRNPLSISSLQTLESAVRHGSLVNLKWLHLQGSFKEANGTFNLSAAASLPGLKKTGEKAQVIFTSFLDALSDHCPKLEIVDLSDNNFQVSVPGAVALAKITSRSNDLKLQLHPQLLFSLRPSLYETRGREINLNASSLCNEGLIAFVEHLEGSCHFYKLALICNNILASGVSCLADGICNGKIVIGNSPVHADYDANVMDLSDSEFETDSLLLDFNPLGLKGTEAICKILESSYCQPTILSLTCCQLTRASGGLTSTIARDIGQRLCQMSPCYSITHLCLSDNSFTGNCIDILFGFMHLCPNLTIFSSSQCAINSDDLKHLLIKFKQLSSPRDLRSLMSWDLSNNNIDDRGVSALIDHLPSLTLHSVLGCSINLENNPTSSEMVTKLNEGIQKRKEVSKMQPSTTS